MKNVVKRDRFSGVRRRTMTVTMKLQPEEYDRLTAEAQRREQSISGLLRTYMKQIINPKPQ